MGQGLPVSKLLNVGANLSPVAAGAFNFNTLLIMGDSPVISTTDRLRLYTSLTDVAADFGTSAPEYLAASLFFGQIPQPASTYIGRWAKTASSGQLVGGLLSTAEEAMANFTNIVNGSFKIAVDGGAGSDVLGLNFSAAGNLNAIAGDIQAGVRALAGAFANVSVIWDAPSNQFIFTSGTTGAASTVAPLVAAASGTNISELLLCAADSMEEQTFGAAAESALAAVTAADQLATQWYGLMFAVPAADLSDADRVAVAQYIEAAGAGSGNPHIFGITTSESTALAAGDTSSIGFQIKALGLQRTFAQWSKTAYAVASMFGRMFTVNFNLQNSTITLQWKVEPGVIAEQLTSDQAAALDANNYNYFVGFNNNTSILVNGKMLGGFFIDEVWGVDWQVNDIQTELWNIFLDQPKVAQTNPGVHLLTTGITHSLARGVNNGLIGEGLRWNFAGFGTLQTNDILPTGYYVFAQDINDQNLSDRQARKAPPIQIAINLAGGIHSAAISLNVNR